MYVSGVTYNKIAKEYNTDPTKLQDLWISIDLLDKEPNYAFVKIVLEESETK